MSKYGFGVAITSIAFGIIFGYNVNVVTGIFSWFAVVGIAFMIGGMAEDILKIAIAHWGK
jgi:hypothetical protein